MSNIRRNVNNIFDLRISRDKFWDLQLSQDNIQCYNCNDIVSGDVIATFDFDDVTEMCSEVIWDKSVSFSGDICDIGLTGVDNRFVDNFSGETFNPSGDTRFCMKRVSGDTYCYEMNVIESTNIDPQYVQFCGGFFQGFYKLHEYEYETLPNFYPIGWTKEFWLRKENCPSGDIITITGESIEYSGGTQMNQIWEMDITTGGTCQDKPSLNEVYPENEGIFYYWGLRAENKFCMFNPLSGLTTCTGIPLSSELEVKSFQPDINPFLYYNRRQVCEGTPNPTVENADCCNGLLNNAIAFRINDEGGVGIRMLTTTGECIIFDDMVKFSGTPIIEEFYSDDGIILNNIWHHVVYRYEPYDKNECKAYRAGLGTMSIFVDGYLKMKVDDYSEFIPYPLIEHKDKQLGVPYNISIGGGTQGLLEAIPTEEDSFYDITGLTICDYVATLVEPCIFGGVSIDGVEVISPPLNTSEPELIQLWLELNIPNRLGKITVLGSQFNKKKALRIEMNGIIGTIDYIIYPNLGQLCVAQVRCYDIPPHNGICGILEENFAGTFIGGIAEFRLHNRPLCFSEIKCNYNQEKSKYNKLREIHPCYNIKK